MSHDHPHHDHEHGGRPAAPKPAASRGPAPAGEDASARALAEALRSSFTIVKFVMVLLVGAFIASGIFTVKPHQYAIKLRFGAPVGIGSEQLLKPGLHWSWPYPIDEIVYVPVGEGHSIVSTTAWYYVTAEEQASGAKPPAYPYLRPGVDGSALTGDGNLIHLKAALTYRITDPLAYAFGTANVTDLLQHIVDNALLHAAARYTADDALYRNRIGFQETFMRRVNELVEKFRPGVTFEPREVQAVPPLEVEQAFDNVLKAQQQGASKILDAATYARGITNRALGNASAILRDGVTHSNTVVRNAAADAAVIAALLPHYQRDPELFKQHRLAQTMQQVLTNAVYKAYLPERADGKVWEVRLLLNKRLEVPKKEGQQP